MKIKSPIYLAIMVMAMITFSACKDKKPAEVVISKAVEVKKETPELKTQEQDTVYPLTSAPKRPELKKVIVKKGEWLYAISRREYGNSRDWIKIYNANKVQINNPDLIYPNQELIIPKK